MTKDEHSRVQTEYQLIGCIQNLGYTTVLKALKVKVNAMDCRDKNVVTVFDDMSIKEGLLYNVGRDVI